MNLEPTLTEPNVQKHNQRLEKSTTPRDRTKSRRKFKNYLSSLIKNYNFTSKQEL